jgi:hypothetical protein
MRSRRRSAEPVQVYLGGADRQRLERLVAQLASSKSDVLRRGLEALERLLADPAHHPALRIIGLVNAETGPPLGYDAAREHDRYLAESEAASWRGPQRRGKRRGRER